MSDVFSLESTQEVTLNINGSESTVEVPAGATLMSFVRTHATQAGIRTFSVYVDGQRATTEQATRSLTGVHSVEIIAKDSRG